MASPWKRINWQPIMQEYIGDPTSTYKSLATKHRVPQRTLRWHARREMWRAERFRHCHLVADKLSLKCADRAAATVAELNERHLHRSEELRTLLDSQLGTRNEAGELVPREDLSISEIARAVLAQGWLYRMDRLALGADTVQSPMMRDRFADMSDEELMEELQRVRARNVIN